MDSLRENALVAGMKKTAYKPSRSPSKGHDGPWKMGHDHALGSRYGPVKNPEYGSSTIDQAGPGCSLPNSNPEASS
jgi:hypothetical protein